MAFPIALAAAAVPSVVKGISGLFGIGKGNRLARNNTRPTYQIPEEFQRNAQLAEQMAQIGLPQQQYNAALQNIGRNQTTAINALSRSANPSIGLASLLRQSNNATLNLDAQDAAARQQNQRFAFGQRGLLGQQKLAKQNWDQLSRYQEIAQNAQALQGAGRQNAFGSLSDLSRLGQSYFGGQNPNNPYNQTYQWPGSD